MLKFEGKSPLLLSKERDISGRSNGVIGQVVIFQDLKDGYDSPLLFTSKLHLSSVIFIFVRFEDSCQLNVKPSLKEHQC